MPTSEANAPLDEFAPRIYAPRIYAPRIYAPRIYAPRIYAPRIYAPRIYAPDSYVPDLASDAGVPRRVHRGAEPDAAGRVGEHRDGAETVTASTGNTDGFFYVRVQGHDDQVFDADLPFELDSHDHGRRATATGSTTSLRARRRSDATGPTPTTVIVTDTNKLGARPRRPQPTRRTPTALDRPGRSDRRRGRRRAAARREVVALQEQVAEHPDCPYAVNLVAQAIKEHRGRYRTGNADSKYVVIAGDDEVIPFFRYPDTSGLGPGEPVHPAGAGRLTVERAASSTTRC